MKIKIVTRDKPEVTQHPEVSGWGDKAGQVDIEGDIGEIDIEIDGKLRYSLRIDKDGQIHLVTLGGYLTQDMESPLRLKYKGHDE